MCAACALCVYCASIVYVYVCGCVCVCVQGHTVVTNCFFWTLCVVVCDCVFVVCIYFTVPIQMCVYVFVNRCACVYVSMRVTCGHVHLHGQVDLKHPNIKHQRRATKLASCLANTCHRINQHVPAARRAKRIQKFLTSPAVV